MSLAGATTATWTLLLAALAALAGCGSATTSSGERPAASTRPSASSPSYDPQQQRIDDATANLTDFFSVYAPMGGTYFTRPEAECIAERVVRRPGIERLQQVGVLNDELQYVIDADPAFTRPDARSLTAAIFGCSDAEGTARRQAVAGLDGATPAERACASRRLTDDLLRSVFVLALQDEPLDPASARVTEALAPCRAG